VIRLLAGVFVSCALSTSALAATLMVGPAETYSRIADAIAASSPGDEIVVRSGLYINDTVAFPHGDLTIRGDGVTRPLLRVTENIPNRKGIFAIPVDAGPVTVEFLHFNGARISDEDGANAAGIRMEGQALTVRDCVFSDNQMGLLAGGTDDFTLRVENSEFDANAQEGSGFEHNIYVGTDQCREFTFIGNYSHHAHSGHQLKSRCQANYILYNRLMDEVGGDASYSIDLPEGGRSVVVGNLLQQGPNAENSSAILSYAAEGTNDEMTLYVAHNTIVNDRDTTNTSFIRAAAATKIVLRNNLFVGGGTRLEVSDVGALIDDQGSLRADADVLVDRDGFDYRLVPGSAPENAGVSVPDVDGEVLAPTLQYLHPRATERRGDDGEPDVGAYEFGELSDDDDAADDDDSGVDDAGCECSQVSAHDAGLWLLLPLALGALRRLR
jgi:hypothetical protein